MLLGIPSEVKRFFRPVVASVSKPISKALVPMVLAFLLAPHYRRLKTIAGMVAQHRVHAGTISRRLVNPLWRTRDWYSELSQSILKSTNRYERNVIKGRKRKWVMIFDSTYHSSVGRVMQNLMETSTRKDSRRRNTKQHVFVMGILISESGVRIPLPRRSYRTQAYCKSHGKKYRTQAQLIALMIREARIPKDVDVTVIYDSAFDADIIHKECRERSFREVFPLDPNRNLAEGDQSYSPAKLNSPVVQSTLDWDEKEFAKLELEVNNEEFVSLRRRHIDNLRVKKTFRRYMVAARRVAVSKLGGCLVVTSYKENPTIELFEGQSGDWREYRVELAKRRKKDNKKPSRWIGKVLACTDTTATARQVIEWYELRWQIEIFFRELKSRMQLGCYVLMKFEAVERYLDLLMMGFLLLEKQRLSSLESKGAKTPEQGNPIHHWRTTDRLRALERSMQTLNVEFIRDKIKTKRGQNELLKALEHQLCQVA
jgi:Transposase DDE domain